MKTRTQSVKQQSEKMLKKKTSSLKFVLKQLFLRKIFLECLDISWHYYAQNDCWRGFFSSKNRYVFPLCLLTDQKNTNLLFIYFTVYFLVLNACCPLTLFCRQGRNHFIIQRYTLILIKCFLTYRIQPFFLIYYQIINIFCNYSKDTTII